MTQSEELRDIARHQSWAFEELVVDCKNVEWNDLHNQGPKAMFEYLKLRYGSPMKVLKAARKVLADQKKPVRIVAATEKAELMATAYHPFNPFDEMVRQEKEKEAKELTQLGVGRQFAYLKEQYGSAVKVLDMLRFLVIVQRGRRKSLRLVEGGLS